MRHVLEVLDELANLFGAFLLAILLALAAICFAAAIGLSH